ncbi:hypothetical protein [Mycobacterium talmoniae]|uniref:Uncharacterized protein n=1 Tax=Mycobacterium talmoniae TaxID=1858794 RepID=A0A1S1N9N1_9MYCO|nr:hypothetical protein [Mycobacterium talmoniae]OHU98200.1 hypothetical protein BKN37_21075 [Mycobacterium talmoniae]
MSTLIFTRDGASVAYTRLEQPLADEPGVVGGGLLAGDPALVTVVRRILTGVTPERVCVAEPNVYYQFTAARDTLADVAAAMLAAGSGRGQLSDLGWDVLAQAVGDDGAQGAIH